MNTDLTLLTAMGRNPALIWELVDFCNAGDAITYSPAAARIRGAPPFAGRGLGRLVLLCTGSVQAVAEVTGHGVARSRPKSQSRRPGIWSQGAPDARKKPAQRTGSYVSGLMTPQMGCPVTRYGRRGAVRHRREYPDLRVELIPLAGPDLVISSASRKSLTQRLMEAAILHGCAGRRHLLFSHA